MLMEARESYTFGGGPYRPVDQGSLYEMLKPESLSYEFLVLGPIEFAIHEINADTGSNYKLMDILKVVNWSIHEQLFTFTAMDDSGGDYAVVQTLQARVAVPVGVDGKRQLLEWRFKGDKSPQGPKRRPIFFSS